MLASAVIIAAPWFILCWLRNGSAFWDDFFWKQHVARFLTPSSGTRPAFLVLHPGVAGRVVSVDAIGCATRAATAVF